MNPTSEISSVMASRLQHEARSFSMPRNFETTHWSAVLSAGQVESPRNHQCLESVCRAYWYPLYSYARRRGFSVENAEDLTQSFFERFLEKNRLACADPTRGRFRSFLLASFKNFLLSECKRANTVKRGSGQASISWDASCAESRYDHEPAGSQNPETVYEKCWATTTLQQALNQVRQDYTSAGKAEMFHALHRFLWEDQGREGYAFLAEQLNKSEPALRVAVMRLRQRCREALRQEIARTVVSESDIEEEFEYLIYVLRH